MNAPDTRLASARQPFPPARAAVAGLEGSRIREVANAGFGLDVLPFWFGEPDLPADPRVIAAAQAALGADDTRYLHNLGRIELREAIAGYLSRLHGRPIDAGRVCVTSAGVQALMLAHQYLLDPGARVVIVTPVWPNLTEAPAILGAEVVRMPLAFDPARGFTLDLDRLLDTLVPGTRALVINSPNNPTGWALTAAERDAILAHCRRHRIWIVADDVYDRVWYGHDARPAGGAAADAALASGAATTASASATAAPADARNARGFAVAPGFLEAAEPDDLLFSVNSFSKSWRMTGFRLGWLVAPPATMERLGVLVEYNTSCAPGFVQAAGLAAIGLGEGVIEAQVERFRAARDLLCAGLADIPGVQVALPPGAMYAFFRLDGERDSLGLAKRLVREQRLGVAPGVAFGPEGEGFIRWCLANDADRLRDGIARLRAGLGR
ncbi:aminotransferase class I/II-fold pyridoxal phosphate-dependent enzyme [Derxia gummosa]|uniref:Aminotransferase class I/II-fold pyridoxal phosphate-dependent enzyme n=1 Tax=Derxia gummosa DSM 723 TaxID=1121388 RepID=A0A9U5CQX4_9BURK|nr:aminotransferase class I/II-fold pyridoxal phosphate-dependent enzyme [Derxia gummosa]